MTRLPVDNQINPAIQQLTGQNSPVNPRVAASQSVGKGVLMTFGYNFWKHDPYPLVIITKTIPGDRIWGVNLHYLTFPYIKNLLRGQGGNSGFSFSNIKGDKYLVNAFRSYSWDGIRQVKILDCSFLLTVMGIVRSFDPAEVEIIRKQVQDQIQQQVNPTTYEVTTGRPQAMQTPFAPTTPVTGGPRPAQVAPTVQPVPTSTISGRSATVPSIPSQPASQ